MKSFYSLEGNQQKLDGGAMFGHIPKALWSRWIAPDDQNRIPLACRSLLVADEAKLILFEAGIGAFFEPKLKTRYGIIDSEHILLKSLAALGLSDLDIDFVVLSHLHFDHAGGLLSAWQADQAPHLLFPQAHFLVSETAWERANNPHPRDAASFLPELNEQLLQSNRLVIITDHYYEYLGADYRFEFSHGHTPGMMLTAIQNDSNGILFAADLIPGTAWVHLPVTMGYDRAPEQLLDEKQAFLDYAIATDSQVFFTHDSQVATAKITKTADGRYEATECKSSCAK